MNNPFRSVPALILMAVSIALLPLSGCKTAVVSHEASDSGFRGFTNADKICVITPADGSYYGKPYVGSGDFVAKSISSALSHHGSDAKVLGNTASREEAIALAKADGCSYVIISEIVSWEDRATEWSGIRDKMLVRVVIFRASDGKEVNRATIGGKSRWVTFGGDHPQDLVNQPTKEYIDSLYR